MEIVPTWLDRYGWKYETLEDGLWVSGFNDDDDGVYPIVIRLSQPILSLSCEFTVRSEDLLTDAPALVRLLQANQVWPIVKFGLDETGSVVARVDLPAAELTYPAFQLGLDTLVEALTALAEDLKPWLTES